MKVDTHQHFWRFDPIRDSWIGDDMQVLKADFLPEMLEPLLRSAGMEGCIAVQADSSDAETRFLLELADLHPFIKGVVGWVDLCSENLGGQLAAYRHAPKLKGFRHVLQSEPDPGFMLRPEFIRGLTMLQEFDFVYDLLIHPVHLTNAVELVRKLPDLNIVVDHLAKPFIKTGKIKDWEDDIRALARYPRVYCKVSGMVTEADLINWVPGDMKPYLDVVFDAFGTERLMFGSDWPVCLLAASYQQVFTLIADYVSAYSAKEQELFWKGNAERFYKL